MRPMVPVSSPRLVGVSCRARGTRPLVNKVSAPRRHTSVVITCPSGIISIVLARKVSVESVDTWGLGLRKADDCVAFKSALPEDAGQGCVQVQVASNNLTYI